MINILRVSNLPHDMLTVLQTTYIMHDRDHITDPGALGRIRAGQAEVAANPRARSAILRVAERTDVPFDAAGAASAVSARAASDARQGGARGRR